MAETIARLHIALSDIEPLIWRVIDVPVDASLKMIHDTIQAAMGWLDYHLWEFEDGVRRYGLPDPEWPDDNLVAAKNVKLRTVLKRGIERLDYLYDMGDNWHHVITIEGIEDGVSGTKYPRYVRGAGRAPPEDVGGTDGFKRFLEAIADPRHCDHKEMMSGIASATASTTTLRHSMNSRSNSVSAR